MRVLREWASRLIATFGRRRSDLDVGEELRSHLDLAAEDARRSGVAESESTRTARLRSGGVAGALESVRDQRGVPMLETVTRDARYGLRTLARSPLVTLVAVVSLALAIGASTAVFSLIENLLLRALPVEQPRQLVLLVADQPGAAPGYELWSYPVWREMRRRHDLFAGLGAWGMTQLDATIDGDTEPVTGMWASGSLFGMLGVRPIAGRTLADSDDVRGGGSDGPVAVASYAYAVRRFGGAAAAVGRVVRLNGAAVTIVGVAPPQFFGLEVGRRFDVAVPAGLEPLINQSGSRIDRHDSQWLSIVGRLRPNQTADGAAAAMRGIERQIWQATVLDEWPPRERQHYLATSVRLLPAATGVSSLRHRYDRPLTVLMIIVLLLLAIACGNVANLLVARTAARQQELQLRASLGASRRRLASQLLVESTLLALFGTAAGGIVAFWGAHVLVQQVSTPVTFIDLSIDARVLAFTAAVTSVVALVCGILPALSASRAAPLEALAPRTHGQSSRGTVRVAAVLVAGQMALSMVLVVAAGLFVRTFTALAGADLGLSRDRVLIAYVNPVRAISTPDERLPLFERIRESAMAVPGVASAAVSAITPVSGSSLTVPIDIPGTPAADSERRTTLNLVSPGWFDTYGIRLLAGRDFTTHDVRGAPPVVIVNEAFARTFLGGANAQGRTVSFIIRGKRAGPPAQIVGIAENAAYGSIRDAVPPTMFVPVMQHDEFLAALSIRARNLPPAALSQSIARAVRAVNPDVSLRFRTLSDQVDGSIARERTLATLSGFFGVLALLLAGLGLYGVTAYAVSRRSSEIAIRMALGARAQDVVGQVLGRVMALVGAGAGVGAGVSLWSSRLAAPLLYGLKPGDPVTIAGAAAVLVLVACGASALPAARAALVDPAGVMRRP